MKSFSYCLLPVVALLCCCSDMEKKPVVVDNGAAMKARFVAVDNCFSTGKVDALDSIIAENMVDHSMDTSMHLPPGRAGLKKMISVMREGTPDLKSKINMMAADGDILMVYGTMSGTNTGPMMGMAATNKTWSTDFVDIIKFDSSMMMTDHWGIWDQMKMMSDLGVTGGAPPPPAKKKK